jgi:Protein kinase domain
MLPTVTRLGRYEVLTALGEGGMGEVYRAKDQRLGRDVAIKILPSSFSADPDRLRRFEQEARATGALNHPNVIVVHDTGQHDGAPYVVYGVWTFGGSLGVDTTGPDGPRPTGGGAGSLNPIADMVRNGSGSATRGGVTLSAGPVNYP